MSTLLEPPSPSPSIEPDDQTPTAPNGQLSSLPTPSEPKPPSRLVGVDLARGFALIGMMIVHVAIFDSTGEPGEVAQWFLTAPSGRASVLFFLLSGVSLSIISARGSRSAEASVLRRRGAVLLIGGLLLNALAWGGSILEHYGMMFLLAPWFLGRSKKTLSVLALCGMVGGPIAMIFLTPATNALYELPQGAGVAGLQAIWGIAVAGTYPLIIWFGFFALGVLLGRLDLRTTRTAVGLVAIGVIGVIGVWGVTSMLDAQGITEAPVGFDDAFVSDEFSKKLTEAEFKEKFGDEAFTETANGEASLTETEFVDFDDLSDEEIGKKFGDFEKFEAPDLTWNDLRSTQPHSGQIGWTFEATSIALAILGLSLLAPAAITRLLRPIAALGSISLTAYLVHTVLVTDVWQWATGTTDFESQPTLSNAQQIALLIGLEVLLIAMATIIVRFWTTGPFERGLKQLTQR